MVLWGTEGAGYEPRLWAPDELVLRLRSEHHAPACLQTVRKKSVMGMRGPWQGGASESEALRRTVRAVGRGRPIANPRSPGFSVVGV